jgi:hypothetical protein
MIYALLGSMYHLSCQVRLPSAVEVVVDGNAYTLPSSTRGISLINLKYYCGGADMWKSSSGDVNDGFLEVFFIPGPIYIGALKLGFFRPKRSTQCKDICIQSLSSLKAGSRVNIQVDGEPIILTAPFKIEISILSGGNAVMLRGKNAGSALCDICC